MLTPKQKPVRESRFIDADIFDRIPQNTIRFKKPLEMKIVKNQKPQTTSESKIIPPKNLKKVTAVNSVGSNLFDSNLVAGAFVEHAKFGKGEVLQIEGTGNDTKAEIKFAVAGVKKLLLSFAKLKIIG